MYFYKYKMFGEFDIHGEGKYIKNSRGKRIKKKSKMSRNRTTMYVHCSKGKAYVEPT
jgi:hypothetical protein